MSKVKTHACVLRAINARPREAVPSICTIEKLNLAYEPIVNWTASCEVTFCYVVCEYAKIRSCIFNQAILLYLEYTFHALQFHLCPMFMRE